MDQGSQTWYGPRTSVEHIVHAIVTERLHQTDKHGAENHTMGAWMLILEAELNEAKTATIKPRDGRDNVISEVVQVAAVCFAILEQYGVKEIPGRLV